MSNDLWLRQIDLVLPEKSHHVRKNELEVEEDLSVLALRTRSRNNQNLRLYLMLSQDVAADALN